MCRPRILLKLWFVMAVMCVVVITAPPHAEAALSCAKVTVKASACANYFWKGGQPSELCCAAVKSLIGEGSESQAVCKCLKSMIKPPTALQSTSIAQLAGSIPNLITACSITISKEKATECFKTKEEG